MAKLYALPPRFETMEVEEVLQWATDKVLQLDAENQTLRERLAAYERALVPTRATH